MISDSKKYSYSKVQQILSKLSRQYARVQQVQIKSCYIWIHILGIMDCTLSIRLKMSRNVTIKANDIYTSTERESRPFTDSFSFKILRNIDPNLDQLDNYRQLIIIKDIFFVYNISANHFHNFKNIRIIDIIFNYYNDSKIWHKFQSFK